MGVYYTFLVYEERCIHMPIRSHSGEMTALLFRFLSAVSDLNPCALFRGYLIAMIPLLLIILRPRAGMRPFFQGCGKLLSS